MWTSCRVLPDTWAAPHQLPGVALLRMWVLQPLRPQATFGTSKTPTASSTKGTVVPRTAPQPGAGALSLLGPAGSPAPDTWQARLCAHGGRLDLVPL